MKTFTTRLTNILLGVFATWLAVKIAWWAGSSLLAVGLAESYPTGLLLISLAFCWSLTVAGALGAAIFAVFTWDAVTSLFDKD